MRGMASKDRLVLTVTNLKGGTTKTTSAVFLAHAFAEMGRRVLLVDADRQGSASEWSVTSGGFPFAVVPLVTRELYRELQDYADSNVDVIVIDTPPLDQGSGIVAGAIRASNMALVPTGASPLEYPRVHAVRELIGDAAGFRADNQPVPLAVLFTRTMANTVAAAAYRQQAIDDGFWVLSSEVRGRMAISQAFGDKVFNASAGPYGQVASELLGREILR